jgi:hypothetical protein
MYLQVKPKRISLRMGACEKLVPIFCGTFEILDRVGHVAYKLAFPPTMKAHNVFHVSLLNKYIHDFDHMIGL